MGDRSLREWDENGFESLREWDENGFESLRDLEMGTRMTRIERIKTPACRQAGIYYSLRE